MPSIVEAVEACVRAGVPGITVHPRADERHITPTDAREVAAVLEPHRDRVEYNIEGDPRPELVGLVEALKPDQCTLVPVRPGELTSEAGWPSDTPKDELQGIIERLHLAGVRVSLFVEPHESAIAWAADLGADRVELYTEPYARAFQQGAAARDASLERYRAACVYAHDLGLGVNAGHDLDLTNLPAFVMLPHLEEVSIGHALISQALFDGLVHVVAEYLRITSR